MGKHYIYTIKYPRLIDRILETYDVIYPDKYLINSASLFNESYQLQQIS
jgi:hypothetical protein